MNAVIPHVTVIIPTLCDEARRISIFQAIRSISSQQGVQVSPLIVVNGKRYSASLLEEIQSWKNVKLLYREEASLPGAVRMGREAVDTPFFAFLDDDDEYLPDSLQCRIAPLLADNRLDVVIGNGWRKQGDHLIPVIKDIGRVRTDPASALLDVDGNWLASCGGLYRSDRVGPEYFDPTIRYLEWTYLAFRLALDKQLAFVPEATYVIHDTPVSLSKSEAYIEAAPSVLSKLLMLGMPHNLRQRLKFRCQASLHGISDYYRQNGSLQKAWIYHLRSLGELNSFFSYFLYTRRLLGATMYKAHSLFKKLP